MLIPVILSGGAGTRLWPLSRELYPKQLLPLVGEAHDAAGHAAAPRRRAAMSARRSSCATRAHRFLVAEQLRADRHRAAGHPARARRPQHRAGDRAGGAGGGRRRPRASACRSVLLVLPADHVIRDVAAFQAAVATALPAAEAGQARDLRRRADASPRPATATSARAAARAGAGVYRDRAVRREARPRHARRAIVARGEYYWNSGMFMFRARPLSRGAASGSRRDIHDACAQAFTAREARTSISRACDAKAFERVPAAIRSTTR